MQFFGRLFFYFQIIFSFLVPFYVIDFVILDTVVSAVDSTVKAAQNTVETGKSYVDSAKGKLSSNFMSYIIHNMYYNII